MKRWVSFWLAVSLLAVLALPASAQTCATPYTVKAGDNLYRIGLAHGARHQRCEPDDDLIQIIFSNQF